jgi:hypothetical protein
MHVALPAILAALFCTPSPLCMVAPSDEMNEEQHLHPLSILNIDDNFVISKKRRRKTERLYFRQHRFVLSMTVTT